MVYLNLFWNTFRYTLCLTKYRAMKAYWGSGGIAPCILHLGTRWRWVVSFTPRPLYPQGKNPLYPLDKTLGEPKNSSGHGGEEKSSQPLPEIEPWNPNHPASSLVAILTDRPCHKLSPVEISINDLRTGLLISMSRSEVISYHEIFQPEFL
jgi:hypothetical protein